MPYDGVVPRIGVIGAGGSGLVYAQTHYELAAKDNRLPAEITFLEAAERVGGRMKSSRLDKWVVDDGAHWLHLHEENRLYRHMNKRGMVTASDFIADHLPHVSTVSDKGVLIDSYRSKALQILESSYVQFRRENPGEDISVPDLARRTGNKRVMREGRISLGPTWAGVVIASGRDVFRDPAVSGGSQVVGGMEILVRRLHDAVTDYGARTELNYRVTAIRAGAEVCIVKAADGRSFLFDRLANTMPIAVLKKAFEEDFIHFDPTPSKKLRRALDGMQMGQMSKVIALFDPAYLAQKARREPRVEQDSRIYTPVKGGIKGYPEEFPSFVHIASAGNPTLTIYIGGPAAVWMEQNKHRARDVIDRVLKHTGIFADYAPHLRGVHVSGFNTDPLVLGAYSAAVTGHKRPRGPIRDRLITYFGEAFAPPSKSPGTTSAMTWSAKMAAEMDYIEMRETLPHRSSKSFLPVSGARSLQPATN